MAGPKPMLTEIEIHHRLESCGWCFRQRLFSSCQCYLKINCLCSLNIPGEQPLTSFSMSKSSVRLLILFASRELALVSIPQYPQMEKDFHSGPVRSNGLLNQTSTRPVSRTQNTLSNLLFVQNRPSIIYISF